MKKAPIGVWFSAALIIFVLGIWVGYTAGARCARYWDTHQRQKQGPLHGAEWAHAESISAQLGVIQTTRLFAGLGQFDKNLAKKYPLAEIDEFEKLRNRPDVQEIRPVVNLYLGFAHVEAAIAEERENENEQAIEHMTAAQALFQSLGWRDDSAVVLKTLAQRELDKWKVPPQTKAGNR